jgi:predicted HicB family RNase H-like nuclease
MSVEAYIAVLDADIARLKAQKKGIVERRARTWARWGTEPYVETTGRRMAEVDRQLHELTGKAAAIRKSRRA